MWCVYIVICHTEEIGLQSTIFNKISETLQIRYNQAEVIIYKLYSQRECIDHMFLTPKEMFDRAISYQLL